MTIAFAAAASIGFDKPSYLIAPDSNQQIYAVIKDETGANSPAGFTTYVYLTPGTTTGQISSKISTPSFASNGATVRITISRGDSRKSFLYKDAVLGESILTATSSGLASGSLPITVGFPPPPPSPAPVVAPVTPVALAKPTPAIIPTPPVEERAPEPEVQIQITATAAETVSEQPAVLSSQLVAPEFSFDWFDQLLTWLRNFFSGKISM